MSDVKSKVSNVGPHCLDESYTAFYTCQWDICNDQWLTTHALQNLYELLGAQNTH